MRRRKIMFGLLALEVTGAMYASEQLTSLVSEDGIAGLASMLGSLDWGRVLSLLLG